MNTDDMETVGIEPTQGSRHLDADAAELAVAECLRRDFRTTLRSAPVTARTAARRVISALENAGFSLTAAVVPVTPTTENPDGMDDDPYPQDPLRRIAWRRGFAAGRAAATPDPPEKVLSQPDQWETAVEVVARALCARNGSAPDSQIVGGFPRWHHYVKDAETAIAAMPVTSPTAPPPPRTLSEIAAGVSPGGRDEPDEPRDTKNPFSTKLDPMTHRVWERAHAEGWAAREAAASPDERLREALAFYADKGNYTAQNPVGSGAHVWRDMGGRARSALAAADRPQPPADERLREAAQVAVFACLPVLHIVGSQNRGYRVSDVIDPKVIADPQEWVDAAHAICELHHVLAAADREATDGRLVWSVEEARFVPVPPVSDDPVNDPETNT